MAKNQAQYNILPVLRSDSGRCLSHWILTKEQRALVAEGADIYLTQLTFGDKLQPVILQVALPNKAADEILIDLR